MIANFVIIRLFDLCRMADSNKPISPIWEHDATPTASIAMMTLFLDYSLCCTARRGDANEQTSAEQTTIVHSIHMQYYY